MSGPISDHVSVSISAASVSPTRTGFGEAMYLAYGVSWVERLRWYNDVAGIIADGSAATSPEVRAATAYFSQNPSPERIAIGRGALPPTQVYTISLIGAPAVGQVYGFNVEGEGVTATEVRVTALADVTISAVANASETFTAVAHGMATGDGPYRLTNSGGGLPSGTAVDTNYWIIRLTADTFQLATTYANAIAETELLIASDGTGTHTVQRDANDVIVAQLVDRLNSVVGNNYIAAQVTGAGDTDTMTVTADAAGDWFSLEALDAGVAIKIAQTHVDPGIATDLAAIAAYDSSWYGLVTSFNSNALVVAAAAWAEAQAAKQYAVAISDSESASLAVGGSDTGDDLHTAGYEQTNSWYHPSPADFSDAAFWGAFLHFLPGSATGKYKPLAGVSTVTLTSTMRTNLRAKNMNTYESVAGVGITWEGAVAASGEWIDAVRDLHWLVDEVQTRVFTLLATSPKIPYTDPGVETIKGVIRGALDYAVDLGVLVVDSISVTAPKVATVSAANRAARILPDVKFYGTRAGAVHKVNITGTVSV